MAEPQPSAVQGGAADPHAPTSTADDRKAAAALSSLDAQGENGVKKEADSKALDKAMKNLHVKSSTVSEEKKNVKNVKVEPGDVNLLVSQLDLSKQKATDLLKAYDGSAVRAMTAFVSGKA
ncbi:uncharacterized protein EKO05_0004299 [Ascochyta rabiei]|uniref:Uncharacterized protein n=1 Tax=Didymella rabiei TaxID=5454 RepID=A0A162Y6R7_DIDRA|nr:uncharacterized protein EKO05_0004299 [Ascochyta rabiei]KZM19847.1 hypothetical protein ST47_g9028 [Ascochyta rabiei]UPX13800.1 hypothetical protein EKO05_0004299 [Ascochyta rabiei]